MIMAYEGSEIARENFGKFIQQFQPETRTKKPIKKLDIILFKPYRQNVSLLFHQICLDDSLLHPPPQIYIYIYIYQGRQEQSGHPILEESFSGH